MIYGTAAQGLVDHDAVLSNRLVIDMSELVKKVDEDIAPFTKIVSTLDFKPAHAEKFEFMEADDFDASVTISVASAAAATSIYVVTGDYVKLTKNMILRCARTGEQFIVTATPSTTTVAVKPNWPTCSSGAALVSGDSLLVLGTAMEYSSTIPDYTSVEPATAYNYVQMMRRSWKVSGRVSASQLYGPDALSFASDMNIREFMKQRERTLCLGKRGRVSATTSGMPETTTSTGGVKYYMDAAGSSCASRDFSQLAVTRSEFNAFLRDAFTYGDSHKLMICGWNILAIIEGWANSKLQTVNGSTELKTNIKRYECAFGVLDIVPHRAMELEWKMPGEAWVVQLSNLVRRGLPGRSDIALITTRGSDNLQAEGEDATVQAIGVEDGLEFRNAECMARAYNIGV
jgi:hypothetical protein